MDAAPERETSRVAPGGLIGRDAEFTQLMSLVRGVALGATAALLEGDPGIGKSALLTQVRDAARLDGRVVLSATGVQSESTLPFAALHQLLRPLQGEIAHLPQPQRESLSASFGLASGTADVFLNALATLTLLAEAGVDAGVLVVVEDVHWLDPGSRTVMEFVTRRLGGEPVAVVFSARSGELAPTDFAGIDRMPLGPLAPPDAAALIELHSAALAPDIRRAVQDQAIGNPLALIELASTATRARGPVTELTGEIPLTTRLELAFAERYATLPETTKAALLVAALNESDSLAEVFAAASVLCGASLDEADIDIAVEAGLATTGRGRITFRHPLVRSAIRQANREGVVRDAHRALASVIERIPDRHLWHLAAAVVEPDDDLADALVATAERVTHQGDLGAAEVTYRRAADLTSRVDVRAHRLLTAADIAARAGRTDAANDLLRQVDVLDAGASALARASLLREFLPEGALRVGRDIRPVLAALDALREAGEREAVIDALCRVASLAWSTGMGRAADGAVLAMAASLDIASSDPRMLHIIAFADPLGSGADVRRACRELNSYAVRDADLAALIGFALGPVGALDDAVPFLTAAIEGLRRRGALRLLVETYLFRAWNQMHRGRFRAAASSADESARLAVDIGEPLLALPARLAIAAADAARGVVPDVRTLLPATQDADELWIRPFLAMAEVAVGRAHLSRGEHDEAYVHLRRLVDESDSAYHSEFLIISFVDFVEAASHTGHIPEARAVVERLEERFSGTDHDVIASGLALSRAFVASVGEAESRFRRALEPGGIRMPFIRARALLAFGSWLRRQRRIAEGRSFLGEARDEFDRLELPAWADKARSEQRAAGVVVSAAVTAEQIELTPQERTIALLAARGLTNKQIGERMFLSHRTIATHLYAIFPKLGISSRDQIAEVLGAQVDQGE